MKPPSGPPSELSSSEEPAPAPAPAPTADAHAVQIAPAKPPRPPPRLVMDGTYKMIKSENGQQYLKKIGINIFARKFGDDSDYIVEIKYNKDTDSYYVKLSIGSRSEELRFRLGIPFDEKTIDGRKCRTLITLKNNSILIQEQRWKKKMSVITYEFKDDKVYATLNCSGATATQVYQKIQPLAAKPHK